MGARQTDGVGYPSHPDLTFHYWLVFNSDGTMRMSRTEPSCGRSEHRMRMATVLPKTLWKTPTLAARIVLADNGEPPINIDISAAQEALRQTLGVDVEVRVVPPEETE